MLFLTLFVLVLITIGVFFVWPRFHGSKVYPFRRSTPASASAGGAPAVRPESLEGVLIVQLMAGEITREQYLNTVEGLAAREGERHPLTVPPEIGPDA